MSAYIQAALKAAKALQEELEILYHRRSDGELKVLSEKILDCNTHPALADESMYDDLEDDEDEE